MNDLEWSDEAFCVDEQFYPAFASLVEFALWKYIFFYTKILRFLLLKHLFVVSLKCMEVLSWVIVTVACCRRDSLRLAIPLLKAICLSQLAARGWLEKSWKFVFKGEDFAFNLSALSVLLFVTGAILEESPAALRCSQCKSICSPCFVGWWGI